MPDLFCVKVIGTLTFDVGFKVTLDKRLITKLVRAKVKRGFRFFLFGHCFLHNFLRTLDKEAKIKEDFKS